ncbi:MAG: hypothetical protein K6A43_04235 [Treponema sp.]|nr:hypothetical protein [Treponema sp.]
MARSRVVARGIMLTGMVFAFLLSALMVFSSCSSLTAEREENVLVKLPVFEQTESDSFVFPKVSRWYVKIEGECCSDAFFVNGSEFYVSLKKNRLTGITAYPLTRVRDCEYVCNECNFENGRDFVATGNVEKEVTFFCCTGAIVPYCVTNENGFLEIPLTWEDGFCAHVLQRVYLGTSCKRTDAADHVEKFNWKKMLETVRTKIETSERNFENIAETFYNPWLLDLDVIIQKIADGSFNASCLGIKGVFSVDCTANEVLKDFVGIDENHSAGSFLVSAFVPENSIIQKYGRVSLKKDVVNLFMTDCSKGVLLCGNKEKNLSAKSVYLPIFCYGYEDSF